MKVALVSPLPPTHSGIADYASHLGRELANHVEVVELDLRDLQRPDLQRIEHQHIEQYHMGNSSLHGPIYEAALAQPGVVVLHDAMLQHFALGWFSRQQYIEEFVYNYGEWSRDRAGQLWLQRRLSAADQRYFRHPLLRRLVERSRAIIVHNPAAARMARQAVPAETSTPVYEVPHFIDTPQAISPRERRAIRAKLGLAEGEVLISCLGYLRPAKRVRTLLDAAELVGAPHKLLLAGEFSTPEYEQALLPRLHSERVIRLPHVSESEFEGLLQATDIGVNLRYPSAAETSGLVMRMMAHGKPVLVTRNEENSDLPADAVIRVDPGESETEMLAYYLEWLATDGDARAYFGRNAAAYVNSRHGLAEVAGRYRGILETHRIRKSPEAPFTTRGGSMVESNRD